MRGRRPCSTAGHEAGGDCALANTAVIHRVGGVSGWEQPSVQWSCGGKVIRPDMACDAALLALSGTAHLVHSGSGAYLPIVLSYISYWSHVQLSNF